MCRVSLTRRTYDSVIVHTVRRACGSVYLLIPLAASNRNVTQ